MYELKKKIGTVLTSKSVGTGPSSYEKRLYQAAVSQRLRNTDLKGRRPSIEIGKSTKKSRPDSLIE